MPLPGGRGEGRGGGGGGGGGWGGGLYDQTTTHSDIFFTANTV